MSADDWSLLDGIDFDVDLDAPTSSMDSQDLLTAPSMELTRVSRRIAGQYVEVLAGFAQGVFGRTTTVTSGQAQTAADSLERLAKAAGATKQLDLLKTFRSLITPATTGEANSRSRRTAITQLRDWIPQFGATLDEDDAQRLISLVKWDRDQTPLLQELAAIRGIGPKRIQRLYAAGLFRVEQVAAADPKDIRATTGIPQNLADAVVLATQQYAKTERQRCLTSLDQHSARLSRLLLVAHDKDAEPEVVATLKRIRLQIDQLVAKIDDAQDEA